jgi:hypothetical protein
MAALSPCRELCHDVTELNLNFFSTKESPMKFEALALAVLVLIGISAAEADQAQNKAEQRLPKPLDGVICDLGPLEKHFQIVVSNYYAADEFSVGNRVVAEETIVWTLEAKAPLRASEVYALLHPNAAPSPFLHVQFSKTVDGKVRVADARVSGYSLIGDRRWIGPKTGPDLAKGDRLQVWMHLGKEGSAGLIEQSATRLHIAAM